MEKALQTMIDNMPEKTGRSLAEWKDFLKQQSFSKHSEAVNYLKKEFGIGHGFANTIVSLSKADEGPQDLVAAQYQGKEALIPIYETLIEYVKSLGEDVGISPKKSSVSILRKRQFILIKPATKSRIDLGFKLKDTPIGQRLEDSGPFGTMCSHRVRLESVEAVDSQLKAWIKKAYDQSV